MTKSTNKAGELREILKSISGMDFEASDYATSALDEQRIRAKWYYRIDKEHSAIIKLFRECVPEKTDKGLGYSLFNSGRDSVIEEMNARIERL